MDEQIERAGISLQEMAEGAQAMAEGVREMMGAPRRCDHPAGELLVGAAGRLVCGRCLDIPAVSARLAVAVELGLPLVTGVPNNDPAGVPGNVIAVGAQAAALDQAAAQVPRARVGDRGTSVQAATHARKTSGRVARRVLGMLRAQGPLTDEQLIDKLQVAQVGATPASIRSRRAELVRAGLVIDTGRRGKTRTGSACAVWAAITETEIPHGEG